MPPRIASVETLVARYPVTGRFRYLPERGGKPPSRDTVIVRIRDDAGGGDRQSHVGLPSGGLEVHDLQHVEQR